MNRTTRHRLDRAVLVALTVFMAGCFEEPVATGERLPLNEKLFGEWKCVSAENADESARLSVLRFDDTQYYAEWSEAEGKADRYRAYAAKLGDTVVVNVQDIEEATEGPSAVGGKRWWTALQARVGQDGALVIQAPAKRILDMSDEKAALRELRATASAASAWQPFARCTRAGR